MQEKPLPEVFARYLTSITNRKNKYHHYRFPLAIFLQQNMKDFFSVIRVPYNFFKADIPHEMNKNAF